MEEKSIEYMKRDLIKLENYGLVVKEHHPKSIELFKFIKKLDLENGDYFRFKSGGDGDNGEFLMQLFDEYFNLTK